MKKLIFLFIILIAQNLNAQPNLQWQKAYGGSSDELFSDIKHTSDGGYILLSSTGSSDGDITSKHGNVDIWVVKLAANGNIEWQKAYGGSFLDDAGSILQTKEGGYILTGATVSNDGDITGYHGGWDAWVVKLNDTGAIAWEKAYGGSGDDGAGCIQQTVDGGYIFTGSTNSIDGDVTNKRSPYPGDMDMWVVKITSTGSIEWQKTYGGGQTDGGSYIEQTRDSGYIVAGISDSKDDDITKTHGDIDEWVLKLNNTGNIIWQKTYGGTEADEANMVHQTADGGYISIGYTKSNDQDVTNLHGATDMWVVKMNDTGAITWQKTLGGSLVDEGFSIIQTANGKYVATGFTNSPDGDVHELHASSIDMWVVSLDTSGTIQWQKTLGGTGDDEAGGIIQTSDGGYLVCGTSTSKDGDAIGSGYHGDIDLWVVKTGAALAVNSIVNTQENIKVFPTLTSGLVNISLPVGYEDANLKLVNALGQSMPFASNSSSLNRSLQLAGIPFGTYLLEVVSKNGLSNFKVVYVSF